MSDSVLCNLQITQCYYELSQALVRRTGRTANWCTFATWASKQAGQTIRKEDLRRRLEAELEALQRRGQAAGAASADTRQSGAKRSPAEMRRLIWEALGLPQALERASEAVRRGNRKVFAEIGWEFARFCALCLDDPAPDAEKIGAFCAGLRPGDPPEGQQYLRNAFSHLYQAIFETEEKRRAELMLLSNIETGYHEQTRLQPEIQEAIEAPLADARTFLRRLLGVAFPYRGWLALNRRLLQRALGRPPTFDMAAGVLANHMQIRTRQTITEQMMTIGLPGGRLRLGKDLVADFPPLLQQISDVELLALMGRFDPTPDSVEESGAADWADLAERLHFIIDLFRCYQETGDLFAAPFDAGQVEVLKQGRLPKGRL